MKIEYKLLMVLIIGLILATTIVTALKQKMIVWTETYIVDGQTHTNKNSRLAPQSCTTNNLACLVLEQNGIWTP